VVLYNNKNNIYNH